jgi:hypothetical protein
MFRHVVRATSVNENVAARMRMWGTKASPAKLFLQMKQYLEVHSQSHMFLRKDVGRQR